MDWQKLSLTLLPKNLLSYCLGSIVRLELPEPLSQALNKKFARTFKLNLSEAELPLSDYRTIEEVFTRKLKTGARLWYPGFASPADGTILQSSAVKHSDEALQIKGCTYSLNELIFGKQSRDESSEAFTSHWYTTIYLAPHNYHRVHTPLAATLTKIRYIPGNLWPVNERFNKLIPGLLSNNERLVFELTTAGKGRVMVVMVGALNVGRIASSHAPELTSNTWQRQLEGKNSQGIREKNCTVSLATGAELGVFMLGSTVVVVCDQTAAKEHPLQYLTAPHPVHVGDKL